MIRFLIASLICCLAMASGVSQTMDSALYRVETYASGIANPACFVFVSPTKMLVCEKQTGRVTIWDNGVYSGSAALDVSVANSGEEGLLGICLDKDFALNGYVYLFYSKAATDGGSWQEDRTERYFWNGSTLVFVNLVFSTPFDSTQQNPNVHHGGYIKCGPDGKVYIWGGELTRGRTSNPRIEQNTSASAVAGAGAIYRLNPDGTIPIDNPFTFHPNPHIQATWIYGVRNGFGFEFDPLTNYFWFTDNGPDSYDELNLGFAGMNGGWLKIMGPDIRDATYSDNNFTSYNASDLVYLTGAVYSDPKFSWLSPIGVTCVAFLSSYKFDGSDRYKMVVGDVNLNQLYLFSFKDSNRNALFYLPGTSDGVADNAAERDQYRFGYGFGGVTDARIGPDGLLYICDIYNGRIYRIRPVFEPVAPETVQLEYGTQISGSLGSFVESDDDKYGVRALYQVGGLHPPIRYELAAHAPVSSTTDLRLQIESSCDSPNIVQTVELFNVQTQAYETVDTRSSPQFDVAFEVQISGSDSRFIDPATRLMKARVSFKQSGATLNLNWRGFVDKFWWKVQS